MVMVVVVASDAELLRRWCAENCQHVWYTMEEAGKNKAGDGRLEFMFVSEQEGDAFAAMANDRWSLQMLRYRISTNRFGLSAEIPIIDEADAWCRDNCAGEFRRNHFWFYFELQEDAAKFLLFWS